MTRKVIEFSSHIEYIVTIVTNLHPEINCSGNDIFLKYLDNTHRYRLKAQVEIAMKKAHIDECCIFHGTLYISGWAFSNPRICNVSLQNSSGTHYQCPYKGRKSPDVEAIYGSVAKDSRFELKIPAPVKPIDAALVFILEDGSNFEKNLIEDCLDEGPHNQFIHGTFKKILYAHKGPAKILEIGSRQVISSKPDFIPDHFEYIGFDYFDGPGVDVIGDAHELSKHFKRNNFDFVYSLNTFEHLLKPWIVAAEIEKVLSLVES